MSVLKTIWGVGDGGGVRWGQRGQGRLRKEQRWFPETGMGIRCLGTVKQSMWLLGEGVVREKGVGEAVREGGFLFLMCYRK